MIQKQFLFPQYYIRKVPVCDDCKVSLQDTGRRLLSDPPISVFQCCKWNRLYNFRQSELEGEWKWRTI